MLLNLAAFFGLLLVFFLPGWLFLGCVDSRLDLGKKAALAFPCSLSLNALLAAWASFLGWPLSSDLIGLTLIVFWLGAMAKRCFGRRRMKGDLGLGRRRGWLLLVVCTLVFLGLVFSLRNLALPPGDDVLFHLSFLGEMLRSKRPPAAADYPYGMHLNLFLLASFLRLDILRLGQLWPFLTLGFLSFFPVGFYLFVQTVFKDGRLALFSSLASFSFFPYFIHSFGMGSHPFIWGTFLTPFFLERSDTFLSEPNWPNLATSLLLTLGLFYTHPSWLITGVLIIFFLLPAAVARYRRKEGAWAALLEAAAFLLLLFAFGLLPLLGTTFRWLGRWEEGAAVKDWVVLDSGLFSSFAASLASFFNILLLRGNIFFFAAFVLGTVLAVRIKKYRPCLLLFFALAFVFFDGGYLGLLGPLYRLLRPWGYWHRIFKAFVFPMSVLSGAGLVFVWDRLGPKRSPSRWLFIGCLSAFFVFSAGLAAGAADQYVRLFAPGSLDLKTLLWIKGHLPAAAVILNDSTASPGGDTFSSRPVDGGGWLPIIADRQALLHYGFLGERDYRKKLYLLKHFQNLRTDPKVRELAAEFGVKYVYYSDCALLGRKHTLSLRFLQRSGLFKEVYSVGGACAGGRPGKVSIFRFGRRSTGEPESHRDLLIEP